MRDTALQKWQSNSSNTDAAAAVRNSTEETSTSSDSSLRPDPVETNTKQDGSSLLPFSCPLCFEDKHTSNEVCILTKCCHRFCFDCMTKWASSLSSDNNHDHQYSPSCPFCRVPITFEEMYTFLSRSPAAAGSNTTSRSSTTSVIINDYYIDQEDDSDTMMVGTGYDHHDVRPLTVSPRINHQLLTTMSDFLESESSYHHYDPPSPGPTMTPIETERFSFMGWC